MATFVLRINMIKMKSATIGFFMGEITTQHASFVNDISKCFLERKCSHCYLNYVIYSCKGKWSTFNRGWSLQFGFIVSGYDYFYFTFNLVKYEFCLNSRTMSTTYDVVLSRHDRRWKCLRMISNKHGHLARYEKLRVAQAPGMPGTFTRHRGLAMPTCITARA